MNQGQTISGVSRVFKELNRAYLTLMEFISGKDAASLLSPSERGGRGGEEEGEEEEEEEEGLVRRLFTNEDVLRQIGHVIAFDLLVNNWDRTPVVWEHGGCNLGNLFFELKPLSGSKVCG
jgi:hypothetical protein